MALTTESGARQCGSWIESFEALTEGIQSPALFRKWAGVMTIAGVLERRVHARVFKRILYPNLYVLLVGPPGVGKTEALREVQSMWNEVPDIHVAPSSVSRASLIDELNLAKREIPQLLNPLEPFLRFNSLQAAITEFGTFLTKYDGEFMSTLNDLYDNIRYKEKKRHMKEAIEMSSPQLNIIAGTTPAWLGSSLPDYAWAEGFSSRVILVFSRDRVRVDAWAEHKDKGGLRAAMAADLLTMLEINGTMAFEEEVIAAFRAWQAEDYAPVPNHPKLEHYIPRRHVHFLKLCIIFSASRSNDMVIRMADYLGALELFLETEAYIPEIFKAIKSSPDAGVVDDTMAFVAQLWEKFKTPISEHVLIKFIGERTPAYNVLKTLELLKQSGALLEIPGAGRMGRSAYKPAQPD